MKVMVQVVKDGGENNLHTHTGDDAFWYVMNGAVKFYGEGDKLIGEFKKDEGILIPRGLSIGLKVLPASHLKSFASPRRTRPSKTSGSILQRPSSG